MKKTFISLLILIIFVVLIIGARNSSKNTSTTKETQEEKIQIVTTVFPLYDFINEVGKDNVNVTMLIPAGVDIHNYEPTPQDIISINNADLFIYMGEDIEYWASSLVSGIEDKGKIINITENISLIEKEEFAESYGIHDDESHEAEDGHSLEKYDTHIWLDPTKSIEIIENIKKSLVNIDSENSAYYEENAKLYTEELEKLDSDIMNLVQENQGKTIAFGGPFSYAYFIERYDLNFVSAYDSCGESSEPSVFRVREVINEIQENNIKVIFYKELSSSDVAKTIAEETGAKMLEFNSVHTVTEEQLSNNASYISIMRHNLENLEEAFK